VPDLKPVLDRLYAGFNYPDSAADPIQIVRRYQRDDDREIVGFVSASLAFGRVLSVLQSIERVLAILGPEPAARIRRFDPRRDGAKFVGVVHRWTRGPDIVALLWLLRQMVDRSGSVEGFFLDGYDASAEDIEGALTSFSTRALALDLGMWRRVSPAKLIVPLDTHVIRVGRCLRLTSYTSPGWRMARDITASLRRLDPDDPVKYDYALCHLGMMNACGFSRAQGDSQCPLRGACGPVQLSALKSQRATKARRSSRKSQR